MSTPPRKRRLVMLPLVLLFGVLISGPAYASDLVPQTWLQGDTIFPSIAFTQPLPVFGPGYNATFPRVNALSNPFLKVTMKEIEQQVLPGYPKTRVWAYETKNLITGRVLGRAYWPAVTIEARRFVPTVLKFVNDLPSFNPANSSGPPFTDGLVQGLLTVDQGIHWADPLQNSGPLHCMSAGGMYIDCTDPANSGSPCCQPFTGPMPAVAHLHGQEGFSGVDGGPDQWFTPNGLRGKGFFSYYKPGPGEDFYIYENRQEPGTLWFHDHALGITRTTVYSGLASFYFIRNEKDEPRNLPSGAYEIEMAIQDRQFDTNGQLFFPDGSPSGSSPSGVCGSGLPGDPCLNGPPPNPNIHPFWNPEFFGDVAIVNGGAWPKLKVEPRRYLFRLLDASNARMYRMSFGKNGEPAPPVYVIGADDNYLDTPANVTGRTILTSGESWPENTRLPDEVFLAPGERIYAVVDFSGLKPGQTITLTNNAPAPFPGGLLPGIDAGQRNMDKIMQFEIIPLKGKDTSCNPAKGECKRPTPIVRLTDGRGKKTNGVNVDVVRQLVLKEHEGPGGPIEVLVNNTHWNGLMSPGIAADFPVDGISELPRMGATELWEIINLTGDAHPIHTHLVQFQLVNRDEFQGNVATLTGGYYDAWAAAFPAAPTFNPACTGGVACPGYGPPNPYYMQNVDGAIGGNPGIGLYLKHNETLPDPEEAGWRDTIKTYPGQVTRFLARWTPTGVPNKSVKPGVNFYSFKPYEGPGYVWHCHILDHEDNEMMRPYKVAK